MIHLQTAEGPACRLRVHIGPNNLVCFESVAAPGQYLGMSNNGAVCKPQKVTPDQVEAKFFVRVQVRYQWSFLLYTCLSLPKFNCKSGTDMMNYTCLQLFHWLTPSIETDVPILDYYHDRVWKAISCCKFPVDVECVSSTQYSFALTVLNMTPTYHFLCRIFFRMSVLFNCI